MILLVYSEINAQTIADNLGQAEYSYYFVLKAFLPTLQSLAEVRIVTDPYREVDHYYAQAKQRGEACILLSFTSPQNTPLGLRCPTIPVLAWEFEDIPNEHWQGQRQQDWRYPLKRCTQAITHSDMTVQAIKAQMGDDYKVVSIPAPVWDKFQALRQRLAQQRREQIALQVDGLVLDSHSADFAALLPDREAIIESVTSARQGPKTVVEEENRPRWRQESHLRISYRYALEWCRLVGRPLLANLRSDLSRRLRRQPAPTAHAHKPLQQVPWPIGKQQLELSGVVFTSLFNPGDARKNWVDMLTAFCTAMRDTEDATLVFKLTSNDYVEVVQSMLICMARLPRFTCRVIILNGYLQGEHFDGLIEASDFIVNASYGEGQCLPLMEFLSCGVPAIAPYNSAMRDYMDTCVGFVVKGSREPWHWPQDPRQALRTCQERIDWSSLVKAYRDAYHCARNQPERYAELAHNAIERMRGHCSEAVARERLRSTLNIEGRP
ncbi:glycosyltransferase [Pseudomonas sp. 5P_3.1_Bac2]|uniref:glycosyltransferase n=1 Tax=Pseudomonas sp. 5P_3.1_Bac2 TaxID=2971617 RepID=UPI0021C95F09|nr:glycosyltransferase [Pseudomonas sp. 5P_3.1_Bac2]MCU1719258.1 glycosyltransferase [Pseudomonas sp. 5P_3.1_Bac2]